MFTRMLLRRRVKCKPRAEGVVIPILGHAHATCHDFMQTGEMLCGIGIVAEPSRLFIEGDLLAQSVRIVHQVPEHAAVMSVVHVAIGHRRISGPTGSDEGTPVAARRHIAIRRLDRLTLRTPLGVVLATYNASAVFEIVFVFDLPLVALVIHIANIEEDLLSVGILRHGEHRVGGLTLIFPLKATTDRHCADGMGLVGIDSPASDIELVSSLIVQIAVAGLPEPMPVIVNQIAVKLVDGGGTSPQIPIQALGGSDTGFMPIEPRGLQQ